jgi:hypothetical protein
MLEQMKSVSNPLTIIALFAALAEIAGTVAIKLVAPELQPTFIWFVMIFPTLIVILFFVTLNFNPKVLYAPSDFRDEENYLAIANATKSLGIEKVKTMIAEAKTEIISEVMQAVPTNGSGNRNKVEEIVNEKLQPVQDAVEDVKNHFTNAYPSLSNPNEAGNARRTAEHIIMTLYHAGRPLKVAEVAKLSKVKFPFTKRVLEIFDETGGVKKLIDEDGTVRYTIPDPPWEEQ